jgi:hypothetical protein
LASNAKTAFIQSAEDVERLMQIHKTLGGEERGRRFQLEVLNKAAVVLITAIWESYCEDIAAEALAHIVESAPDAGRIPTELKKMVAKELKSDKNEIAVWALADSKWKEVLKLRLQSLAEARNRNLNAPKTSNIIELFNRAIGLADVSSGWRWQGMSMTNAKAKLDGYVQLRGAIAHRGHAAQNCSKAQVMDYFNLIHLLVGKTEEAVKLYVWLTTKTHLS